MYSKFMLKVTILASALLIFFSGCSEFKATLDMQTALDLEVGDCYIELSQNDMKPGEPEDLEFVDVVSCSEPHSHEIIAKYPSVPLAYRTLENPIDEVCLNATLAFVAALHPSADDSLMSEIYGKFDERFTYIYLYNQISIDSMEPDLNESISCAIMSKDSLNIGFFQKIIESL